MVKNTKVIKNPHFQIEGLEKGSDAEKCLGKFHFNNSMVIPFIPSDEDIKGIKFNVEVVDNIEENEIQFYMSISQNGWMKTMFDTFPRNGIKSPFDFAIDRIVEWVNDGDLDGVAYRCLWEKDTADKIWNEMMNEEKEEFVGYKQMFHFDKSCFDEDYEEAYKFFIKDMNNLKAEKLEWVDVNLEHPTLFANNSKLWENDCTHWIWENYNLTLSDDDFSDHINEFFDGRHYLEYGWTLSSFVEDSRCIGEESPINTALPI